MTRPGHEDWPCLSPRGEGCVLQVSVVPNARRTAIDGMHDGAVRVRLAAPPIEGRANEALVAWIAKSLGVPRRTVALLRGDTSRRKQLMLDHPAQDVRAWLERVIADRSGPGAAP